MVRILSLPVAALLATLLVGCEDNIGRLFDPDVGGGPGGSSGVVAVPAGGDVLDVRPRVVDAFPKGGGWPSTVPVVVVFNESMNQESVAPMAGDPLVFLRVSGTDVALQGSYDLLRGGSVVVIRPLIPLDAVATYEVVVDPEARDVDGLRFGGTAPEVVATFTADQDPAQENGRILAMLPRDNRTDVPREGQIFAIFDKPADTASVTPASFSVASAGGAPVTGALGFPLRVGPVADGRVLRFTPSTPLPGDTEIEITVDATISFGGSGVLEFMGKTPFSSFRTLAFEQVIDVVVGNPVAGFPDQINLANMETLIIDVEVPASVLAGDALVVRVYGLDPKTGADDDVNFVEVERTLTVAGAQTVSVDFSGVLGTLAKPRFSDGPVTMAAQLRRGSRHAGYVLSDTGNAPRLDVTPPDLIEVGPPMAGNDILTDLEQLAFYGTATERIGSASLTDGATTVGLFAAEEGGRFVMEPLFLGRRTSPLGYSLTLTDDAGNMAMMALAGNILQRGVVTGVQAGTLTVEAYDEATLQVLPAVTVVLDPGVPTVPATGQITGVTGPDGRAVFTGLVSPTYTVTLMRGGYHLRTLYVTGAAHVSLPLRSTAGGTAFLAGTALFASGPGDSVLVGCNAIDDPRNEEIATSTAAPTNIPATPIRPGRPLVLSAFAGTFEPTGKPTYDFYTCQMCGLDGATASPPAPPAAGTGVTNTTLALLPSAGALKNLLVPVPVDFGTSVGLGAIAGNPTARVVTSLNGFSGQTLMGVGFSTLTAGSAYDVDGSYSLLSLVTLATYAPVTFLSTEAADAAGNIARHRGLLDPFLGTVFNPLNAPGIPTIAPPAGPFAGSPAVSYMDHLDRTAVTAGFAMTELTAVGAAGRRWALLIQDTNGAVGSTTVQFPDLSGVGVAGLVPGVWSIRAEDYLYLSTTFGVGDLLVEERFRQQVAYARARAVDFTVN